MTATNFERTKGDPPVPRYQGGLKSSRGSRESLDREEGEGRRARRSVSVEQEDGRGQGARGRCRRMPSARGAFLCSKEVRQSAPGDYQGLCFVW